MMTFIVNPAAGSGFALQVEKQLVAALDKKRVSYQVKRTHYPGHATELARQSVQEGTEAVVAVGGDGTCFEVACGMLGTETPMGIIPAGTGNDFIKSAGIPKQPLEALTHILAVKPRHVDVCSLNDRMFLNVCGVGFDVTVLDYTAEAKRHFRGKLPYLIGLVKAISSYRPVHVRLTVDGVSREQDALICAVANGRFIGGGIPICPKANVTDGKLNLVLVHHKPRWMIPFYLPSLLMGRVLKFPFTEHVLCEKVEISSPGMRLQADGEIMDMDRADVAILQGQLVLLY